MSLIEELFGQIDEVDVVQEENDEVISISNTIFESNDDRVKDNKSHFPLVNEDQARKAILISNRYQRSPRWFKGTVKELRTAVVNAVKKEFPLIELTEKVSE